jgi:hypothetical protein
MDSVDKVICGVLTSVKLMDVSYVMAGDEKPAGVTVDIDCRHLSPCWPNPLYSTYYRKILDAYGLGPVLCWQDRRIVGFLPVGVVGCGIPELPLCVHYTGVWPTALRGMSTYRRSRQQRP